MSSLMPWGGGSPVWGHPGNAVTQVIPLSRYSRSPRSNLREINSLVAYQPQFKLYQSFTTTAIEPSVVDIQRAVI